MKVKKAFYVSFDEDGFRPYEKGEVVGLKWASEDKGENWYLYYIVLYKDGFINLVHPGEIDKWDLV
jgi:hypothetical protein